MINTKGEGLSPLIRQETARILGVAPANIRNQTQSVYSKFDVNNPANLAAIVNEYF
ncbi:MAG: DNA-binding CsgD family transcriptional regulator [Paracoccaceae bacterium]